jgi:hypothetical protein
VALFCVTPTESAEASVERNKAMTSDKRKRLRNTVNPPKTKFPFSLQQLMVWTRLRSATAIPTGSRKKSLLVQPLAVCGNGKVKKVADGKPGGWN